MMRPRALVSVAMPTAIEIPLKGPGDERVDFVRTIMSHGVADLPPGHVDEEARAYTTTLALTYGQPRTVLIREGRLGVARVEVEGRKPSARDARDLAEAVRQILNLDEDRCSSTRSSAVTPSSPGDRRSRADAANTDRL